MPLTGQTLGTGIIWGAVYLLWMYQRVVLGEPSAFLLGLKHHLTDMTATEVLTIAPLGALVVVFGLFPGILLKLIDGSGKEALQAVAGAVPITLDPLVPAVAFGAVVAVVVVRLVALRPGQSSGEDSPAQPAEVAA